MFTMGTAPWEIILRTVLVYALIYGGLRLSGKRELGQMSLIDFVVLLLLANAVQNAMVGPDSSLVGGAIAALTLLLLDKAVAWLAYRFPRLRNAVEGTPTILIRNGQVIEPHLQREKISHEDLMAALRQQGVATVQEVAIAILETDGKISVLPQKPI